MGLWRYRVYLVDNNDKLASVSVAVPSPSPSETTLALFYQRIGSLTTASAVFAAIERSAIWPTGNGSSSSLALMLAVVRFQDESWYVRVWRLMVAFDRVLEVGVWKRPNIPDWATALIAQYVTAIGVPVSYTVEAVGVDLWEMFPGYWE